MEKKIAVIWNKNKEISSMQEAEELVVYSYNENMWEPVNTIETKGIYEGGMAQIRSNIAKVVKSLGDCKIIAGKDMTGFIYSILDSEDFIICEFDTFTEADLNELYGQVEGQLGSIKAEQEAAPIVPTAPVETDTKGDFFFDFSLLKEAGTGHSSKSTILPFLSKGEFNQLEIVCDHVMPWFEGEMARRELTFEVKNREDNKISIFVWHNIDVVSKK